MRVDPLDEVIREFEREQDARQVHQAKLARSAQVLVNGWQQPLHPILDEMNAKLSRFGIHFNGLIPNADHVGLDAGATLTVSLVRTTAYKERRLTLTLTLTDTGTVQASACGTKTGTFEPREIDAAEPFPEQQVRQLLADFAGHCLRPAPA